MPTDPLPTGDEKVGAVRSMFDRIAPRYDLVNRIMTFGLDTRWRRRAVRSMSLAPGALVLDIACGTGDLCRELERSDLKAIGFDLSYGMLHVAKTDAPLVQSDALRLPVGDGVADGITCGFALRNVLDIEKLFQEFARVLTPGGRIAVIEVAEPENRFFRWGHRLYFHRLVPFIGGLLSDKKAYAYLPKSTAYLPPRDELVRLIQRTGFPDASSSLVGLGAAQIITARRS